MISNEKLLEIAQKMREVTELYKKGFLTTEEYSGHMFDLSLATGLKPLEVNLFETKITISFNVRRVVSAKTIEEAEAKIQKIINETELETFFEDGHSFNIENSDPEMITDIEKAKNPQ